MALLMSSRSLANYPSQNAQRTSWVEYIPEGGQGCEVPGLLALFHAAFRRGGNVLGMGVLENLLGSVSFLGIL
ncbi:MAG: hypothetical protein K0S79_2752 [Nitrospira sp.]|nr:hypothetical protein [Nitrospira sp.]